ncbi:MAG: VIT1/CCC1 transporter family protein [Candidatus Parcubacteria bacterium]|nr:VIT1/CCC1 transporter family protein [Candidatus Parcubacteria bacterium]
MKNSALYLRSVVFGMNDSLVSTVGFLAGISVAGVPRATLVLTGVIYALVEAFSMAMGDFLSEESAEEYVSRSDVSDRSSIISAVLMFISCVFAALIPLVPYILFASGTALVVSICLSVSSLFVVGMVSARFSRLPVLWRGVRMASLGGAAIVMGVAIGLYMPAV